MQRITSYLLVIASCCVLTSCYPTIHFADRANSPGFTKKGELKFVGSLKLQGGGSAIDTATGIEAVSGIIAPEADIAYAITDHIAITGGYTSVTNRYTQEGEVNGGFYGLADSSFGGQINLHGGELGAGYFTKVGRITKAGIYGNFGMGQIVRKGIKLPQYDFKTNYYKFSLQPEFGLSPGHGRRFCFTTGFRITMLKYANFNSSNPLTKYAVGYYDPAGSSNITNGSYFYFEPYANIEVGYKYVKFNFQFGITGGIGAIEQDLGQMPYLSLGLLFHRDPDY